MKSNGPTRRDKFSKARAKLEDITKKGEGGKEGERGDGREKGGGKCLWLVRLTAF